MGEYDLVFVTKGKNGRDNTFWTDQSIRVDEYRLPTMKAEITGPKAPPVRPTNVPLSLFVRYLSSGPAPGLPVQLPPTIGRASGRARVGYYGTIPVVGAQLKKQ